MEQEKRNQYILVSVVVILLIVVFAIGLFLAIKYKNKHLNNKEYYFNQVYYSEYKLDMIDENYFIGYLEDKQVNVIINKNGKEIFNNGNNIYYDGVYKTKEDTYIIYSNRDNNLVIYSFDGEKLEKIKEFSDVSYAKPIIYTNGNIEYIVGFTSQDNNNLYLYMLNDLETTIVNNVSLVGDKSVQGVYYTYSNNSLIVVNSSSLYGAIDFNGKQIISFKYKDLINTYDNSYIVQNSKGNYGIINNKEEAILKNKYKAIGLFNNYYLVVDSKNNMAVLDKDYKNLVGFNMKYDPLIDFDVRSDVNSIYLWRVGNNLVVVNNYLQDFNKTEYSKSSAYFIKNNKIIDTVKEVGFANEGIVYSYDKNYNVSIYDSDLTVTSSFKLEDATKIVSISRETDDIVKIVFLDEDESENIVYYQDGKEIDFDYGTVVGKKDDIYVIKKDDSIRLYNRDLNELDKLEGSDIVYKNGYLIVDNGIYRIEKRG